MATGSKTNPLATWTKCVEAIEGGTFFAQEEGESADDYVARINTARNVLADHLKVVKDAATKMNAQIKEGRAIHPDIFNRIEPTHSFREGNKKNSPLSNLKF